MEIPLSQPEITKREKELVNEVLGSTQLALGPKLQEFEEKVAAYVGTEYAVGVNSGTSGLHLLVRALGIGEGDEVITTPFSFIASSNCLLFERARPVFVDIDPCTKNIDPARIEAAVTPRTKAVLPVHVFGHPADMEAIGEIARRRGLAVIEDACEAIGAEVGGRRVGTFGDGAVFAFYPNKQMTTGEGGMVVTDDSRIARLCRSMSNQGRAEGGGWLSYERLGYNYRMGEIAAALGIAQLERLEEILEKRRRVAEVYDRYLREVPEVETPCVSPGVKMSWFVYVIRLAPEIDRDRVMAHLAENGIGCRPYFSPIHLQPLYAERFGFREGDFPETERVSRSTLALPFYNRLAEEQIARVVEVLKSGIDRARTA